MQQSLLEIVNRFAGRRVVLVGDFMLDRYIFGDVERISPEAPVGVVHVNERTDRVGGAGSVALNIVALDAAVQCIGMIGRDLHGERVASSLKAAGADVGGLIRTDDRPTITKTRVVGLAEHRHRQQLLRIDDEIVEAPTEEVVGKLLAAFQAAIAQAEIVCLEDYAKGLLTPALCDEMIKLAKQHDKPVFVDPARKPEWNKYRGATLLTPNFAELEIGCGRRLSQNDVEPAAADLLDQLQLSAMVVTLGRDGALLVRKDGTAETVPTTPRAVYDNTGAGDAVLATMAVASAAGANDVEAVQLANIAGGLEVEKFGCIPIARQEMIDEISRGARRGRGKLREIDELVTELDARRQRGETVVFTNGCFDLLHPGHLELLERAKSFGSLLVVGLNSDSSVRAQNKGDDRPIRNQEDRSRMLAALEVVDYITIYDDDTPLRTVQRVQPDVLVKGSDWAGRGVVGRDVVEARGGRVELVDLVDGFSTTGELERIRTTLATEMKPA